MCHLLIAACPPFVLPYHRGRNQGGPAPQYINQPPPPPNVGAIKGILTVKIDFFIHIPAILATFFKAQAQIITSKNLLCFIHSKKTCAHICMHVYVTGKNCPQYQTSSCSAASRAVFSTGFHTLT